MPVRGDAESRVAGGRVKLAPRSRSSYVFQGLESYKPYWFSITAIGTAGESDQSKPIPGRAA